MMQLPYNFVPLSRFILRPDWAEQANHDQPFADGLSGELAYSLTNHSPLCVGGEQTASSAEAPGKVHFYRTPDGHPAIPGSSLKGMLRAVTEIATFSHFNQLEDRRLGVRDLSQANNFYLTYMRKNPTRAGWLSFNEGHWYLTPCQFVRLHQQDLIDHLKIPEATWTGGKANTVAERYDLIGGLRSLTFNQEPYKNHPTGIAKQLGQGQHQGTLVVTGQPGAHFKRGQRAKKWEFIFFKPTDAIPVPAEVMADFQFIHGESKEWEYWRKQVTELNPGVPVFFHAKPDGSPRSIGLSMLYKLAYEHSLHDAVSHTQPAHLETGHADMADLLFGRIDSDDSSGSHNLRGRVNIGLAQCTTQEPRFTLTQPTVLNGPKASFYPAYIRQPENGTYHTLMDHKAELSGWKRYPVKDMNIQSPADGGTNKKVQVQLETVATSTCFEGKIRFHNLRPCELGALLWSLDFGGRGYLSHGLGTGKPYGLGQVSLKLDPATSRLRANDPQLDVTDTALLLGACRSAFDSFIQNAWGAAVNDPQARWDSSEPLVQLLAMADTVKSDYNEDLVYMTEPKLFANAKNANERRTDFTANEPTAAKPLADYQPSTSAPGISLTEAISERQTAIAQEQEQQAREAAKAEMSAEACLLADIEDQLLAPEPLTKTALKNVEKGFREALEVIEPDDPLKGTLCALTERGDALGNKLISKVCKKIRDKLDC